MIQKLSIRFSILIILSKRIIGTGRETRGMDPTVLGQSAAKSTLLALESVMSAIENHETVARNDDSDTARELLETLDDDEYCVFARSLRSYFFECGYDDNIPRHQKICLSMLTYVSCCGIPTLTDTVRNDFVVFDHDRWRTVHRVVSAESFYGLSKEVYDAVSVPRQKKKTGMCLQTDQMKFCFGLQSCFCLYE